MTPCEIVGERKDKFQRWGDSTTTRERQLEANRKRRRTFFDTGDMIIRRRASKIKKETHYRSEGPLWLPDEEYC
ncbi:hypothetical protein NPIL_53551 [Nephila pilipes]|uniref:Uncharacterized protein n=1 Tax=Nephila pilipes TaxID=299642 RepID=A0A8X6TVA5_NEPPI|nr:hypothetical protein NPIL_53551 [Nephila pilipes]